jgi:hypothetical protein
MKSLEAPRLPRRPQLRVRSTLFKPSLLAIVADAGCVLVVALTPIPMLEKISYIGTVWIFSILISALIMTPVLLSWFQPRKNADGSYSHKFVHPINIRPVLMGILALCTKVVTTKARYVYWVLRSWCSSARSGTRST